MPATPVAKKRCPRCRRSKARSRFYVNARKNDGLQTYCVACSSAYQRKRRLSDPASGLLYNATSRARKKGQSVDITVEDVKEMLSRRRCAYCACRVVTNNTGPAGARAARDDSATLDRIDSEIGYVKGNVVIACWVCNVMKGSLSYTEFLERAKRIYDHSRADMENL